MEFCNGLVKKDHVAIKCSNKSLRTCLSFCTLKFFKNIKIFFKNLYYEFYNLK